MINPGSILWKFRVDVRPVTNSNNPNLYGRAGSTPAAVQGRVYIGGDEFLYALDAATGAQQWRFNTPGGVVNSPAIAGDTVYFESGDSTLYALAAATGEERWRFTGANPAQGAGAIFTDPVVSGGVVYVGSVQERVYALDALSGRERWRVAVAGRFVDTPAVADGRIYFGTTPSVQAGAKATFFYSVNTQTGRIAWRVPLDSEPSSPPAVVNGVVYFTGPGLGVYALDDQTGQTNWRYSKGHVIADAPAVA
jgi:outer membrane protein assembly factor BamB